MFREKRTPAPKGLLILPLFLLCWLIARLLGDTYLLSQWLGYLPIHLAILGGLLSAFLTFFQSTKISSATMALLLLLSLGPPGTILFTEYQFFAKTKNCKAAISCFWWHIDPGAQKEQSDIINSIDADLILLLHGSYLGWGEQIDTRGRSIHTLGKFRIHTRFELIEHKPLIASEGIWLHSLTLAVPDFKKHFKIWLIDLPSSPMVSKNTLLLKFNEYLSSAKNKHTPKNLQAPDCVIGDFNMPRHSTVLKKMFPLMHHAYQDAGIGLDHSYPARFPLWLIDHVFLSSSFQASHYDVAAISKKRRHSPQSFTLCLANES